MKEVSGKGRDEDRIGETLLPRGEVGGAHGGCVVRAYWATTTLVGGTLMPGVW